MANAKRQSDRWNGSRERKPAPGVAFQPSFVGRGLGVLLATSAVTAATALTAYAVLREWWPAAVTVLPYRVNLESNLNSGVVFFWLELFTLVVGIRLYDEATQQGRLKRRLARKFETTALALTRAIDRIWEERIRFADALISAPLPSGSYGVPLAQLNQCLREIRNDFLSSQLADRNLTDHTRLLADRVLRILDNMVEDSFDVGVAIQQLHDQLERDYDDAMAVNHSGPDDPGAEPSVPAERSGVESGMDDLLDRLFEAVRPDRHGLEGLAEVIAEGYEKLGLGRAQALRLSIDSPGSSSDKA